MVIAPRKGMSFICGALVCCLSVNLAVYSRWHLLPQTRRVYGKRGEVKRNRVAPVNRADEAATPLSVKSRSPYVTTEMATLQHACIIGGVVS